MDTTTEYYALALIHAGAARAVLTNHRMLMVSNRLVSFDGTTYKVTDKGKDRMARKGK